MPVADHATYCKMLENAYANGFAYPAINVTSMTTANACLQAFAEKNPTASSRSLRVAANLLRG